MNIVTMPTVEGPRPRHAERLRQAIAHLEQNPREGVYLPGLTGDKVMKKLSEWGQSGKYRTTNDEGVTLLTKKKAQVKP